MSKEDEVEALFIIEILNDNYSQTKMTMCETYLTMKEIIFEVFI
jgi:hypothetical protein